MSKQQRSQNTASGASQKRNQKHEKSARPTLLNNQQQPAANRPAPISNKQQSISNKQPLAADSQTPVVAADRQPSTVDVQCNNASIASQLGSKLILMTKCASDQHESLVQESVLDGIYAIESKIRDGKMNLQTVSEIRKFAKQIGRYAVEKWQHLDDIHNMMNEDYSERVRLANSAGNFMRKRYDLINKAIEESNKREKLFAQECELNEQRLDKINSEIASVINARDIICSQIAEMKNLESTIVPTIDDFRQSNELLKQEIGSLQLKYEDDVEMAAIVTQNASQWIDDKKEVASTLDYVKSQLKKDKKKVSGLLKKEKTVKDNLSAEVDSLIKEVVDLEDHAAETQKSTQLRIVAAEAEFEQKLSSFSVDLEKIRTDTKLLQFEADKKQSQFDNLQRLIKGGAELRESIKVLEQKIVHLESEKWKQDHKIAIMDEYINETNQRRNKKSTNSAIGSKRRRLPPSKSIIDDRSLRDSGSSYDLRDLSSETMSRKSAR